MSFNIRQAGPEDIPTLYRICKAVSRCEQGYFEEAFDKSGVILIIGQGGKDLAYGFMNMEPKYSLYKTLQIPEIQDLNVLAEARQQGLATLLVQKFESIARNLGYDAIGISVGLTKNYGPAQRLYFKLGYMPDGYGATYDRQGVTAGQMYRADDDFCLMMVKQLV